MYDLNFQKKTRKFDADPLKSRRAAWSSSVDAQYALWDKAPIESRDGLERPMLANALEVDFGGFLSMVGFEIYPPERTPGSLLWIRTAFRREGILRKPVELLGRFTHRKSRVSVQVLMDPEK